MAGNTGVEVFARSRGWEPGEMFVDDDPTRPMLAWWNLATMAWGLCVAAVLVPDAPGLRPPPSVLRQLRIRCAREVGAPLLPAPPVTEPTVDSVAGSVAGSTPFTRTELGDDDVLG